MTSGVQACTVRHNPLFPWRCVVIARKKTVTQRLSLTSAVGGGGGVRLGQRRVREETREREREVRASKVYASL